MEDEVSSLEGVDEGHPSKVSDGKHEAESIGGDVHSSEDGRLEQSVSNGCNIRSFRFDAHLVVQAVSNVQQLEKYYKHHRVCGVPTATHCLLACSGDVNQSPQDETRAELVEGLEVE